MTIAEHSRLCGPIPPLPNQVINLREIPNLKFFNTNYREYLAVYNNYIIGVYPFAIKIEHAFDGDNNPMTYEFFKTMGVRSAHHHNDYTTGYSIINVDPCALYEEISGIRIHHGESDDWKINIDYKDPIKAFESEIISQNRNNKIDKLLISENH